MTSRVFALLRARLSGMWLATFAESAPLWMHAVVASALCLLVRDELPPFAYSLVVLSASAALLALPLLGEFGAVLRTDPAREWVEALPVRRVELVLARVLLVALSVALLACAALVPAAVFAPAGFGLAARLALVGAGLAQAPCLCALLLAAQALLRGALESWLVLLQTALVAGVLVGGVAGLRLLHRLRDVGPDAPALAWYPPAWFAAADERALAAAVVSIVIVLLVPAPTSEASSNRVGLLERCLLPLRALASRVWVRRDERAAFDLVYDGLPREREFVIRTYPMLGIPLAFLLLGVGDQPELERDVLMSVLLFTPAAYLPVLLTHVPATRTPEAGWLLETAPVGPDAIANGALKAVVVRFLAPLFALLAGAAIVVSGAAFTARLLPSAVLVTLIAMRRLYPTCATAPPLSRATNRLETEGDLAKSMFAQSLLLPVLGILVWHLFRSLPAVLALFAGLLVLERLLDTRLRGSLAPEIQGDPTR